MSPRRRRVLVVTGETSGERHMARVMEAMRRRDPSLLVEWFGSGGPEMVGQQLECLQDVTGLAAIGPLAALAQLGGYLRFYRKLLSEVDRRRPDLAVLVDFPEFNLRLARSLAKRGVPICYFIGPQVWAWRPSRVELIRRYVDRMLVIFPFEEGFYRSRGVRAHFVGNPTAELRREALAEEKKRPGGLPLVALMPGSRRKEVEQILPIQLSAAAELFRRVPCRFRVLRAPGLGPAWLLQQIDAWRDRRGPLPPMEVLPGESPRHLAAADCALVKSGTSTLEALILEVPFAMVYRMSSLSYRLLRPWVATQSFCLANLVAGENIAPEFVQDQAQPRAISEYLERLLTQPGRLNQVKQKLRGAAEKLERRQAYPVTARHILEILKDGVESGGDS